MKLYVGSRDYKPDGYVTVDIDPTNKPDIVADITNMAVVSDGSCDEVVAGHVLEHIEWPDSFAAMAEFARVLKPGGVVKIALPDMSSLTRMLLSGESAFHVMGLIYGLGGRVNTFERHRYGFTPGMLVDILEALGFGEFNWWNSSLSDASNGWAPRGLDERIGMSLNMQAVKVSSPTIDPKAVHEELLRTPMDDFVSVVARVQSLSTPDGGQPDRAVSPKLLQLMHFQLIDAHQRTRHLEERLIEAHQRIRHLDDRPAVASQEGGIAEQPSRDCSMEENGMTSSRPRLFAPIKGTVAGEDRLFSTSVRCPIRLEAFSVLARIIRHATYAEDAPPTQASLWSIHHDLQGALRSGHPEWIHEDRLHVRFADREAMAVVDLTNTQFIGADRSLATFRHGYEPEIGILIDAFVPDDGVLADVGANWGYFALFLAARPGFRGRVLAVEPFPASAAALAGVISATGIGHLVEPVAVALGAAPGTATMSEELFTGNNRISGEGALAVPVDTLDRLVDAQGLARLDLMKIDVEGAEAEVIQGASRMIARHRPMVVFENWLDGEGCVDAAPFLALEAIAPHAFYVIDLDSPTSTPAGPVATMEASAPVTGRVIPLTVDSRAALPPRVNVVACRPDIDLAARLNINKAWK